MSWILMQRREAPLPAFTLYSSRRVCGPEDGDHVISRKLASLELARIVVYRFQGALAPDTPGF